MDWTDEGIVLSARRHGEAHAIASLLTRAHGRHAGLVHGGWGRRRRAALQPGNAVHARWRARLSEQLGTFVIEPARASAGALFNEPLRLAALASACALADSALPEREPHPAVHDALGGLIAVLEADAPGWPEAYVRWEIRLLGDLGFGLDLTRCAQTGAEANLAFVSPKTGRAVSAEAAGPWREKLLPLPAFLVAAGESPPQIFNRREDSLAAADGGNPEIESIAQGLALTAHFLERHVFAPHGRTLPAARRRLAALRLVAD